MDTIIHQVASLGSAILISSLGFIKPEYKIPSSVLVGDLIRTCLGKLQTSNTLSSLAVRGSHVVIKQVDDEHNHIYQNLQVWLMQHYSDNFRTINLVPNDTTPTFEVAGAMLKRDIWVQVDNTKIKTKNWIQIKPLEKAIQVSSKTMSVEQIKDWIQTICSTVQNTNPKTITIYNIDYDEEEKRRMVYWKSLTCITNKNMNNLAVADSVQTKLDQLKYWLTPECEADYSRRGLPYQRGILLYGPPGTGKSSYIKAMANQYNMLIFNLNLDNILNDKDFEKLINIMHKAAHGRRYIVAIEDFDRTKFVYEHNYRTTQHISMTTFINFLDGITEAYGRLIIITANDISKLTNFDALNRPGRIDMKIELGYCDQTQHTRICKAWFPDKPVPPFIPKTTPAQLISNLQSCDGDLSQMPQVPVSNTESCTSIRSTADGKKISHLNRIIEKRSGRIKRLRKELNRVKKINPSKLEERIQKLLSQNDKSKKTIRTLSKKK